MNNRPAPRVAIAEMKACYALTMWLGAPHDRWGRTRCRGAYDHHRLKLPLVGSTELSMGLTSGGALFLGRVVHTVADFVTWELLHSGGRRAG
jgi:hypothetical protein